MGFNKLNKGIIFLVIVICVVCYVNSKLSEAGKDVLDINLSNICDTKNYTEFVFNFKNQNITLRDPFSKIHTVFIRRKYLENSFFVKCNGKKRVIILKEGAILKSNKDSIDIERNSQKLHGYMGIFTNNSCYYVDHEGYFWGDRDSQTIDNPPKEMKKYCNLLEEGRRRSLP